MSQAYYWAGWWQQEGWGRQQMHDLILQITDGMIQGGGHDAIGEFTFSGTFGQNGDVSMVKQYIGQHDVMYQGTYDGEGMIHGEWNIIGVWRGPFAIMLRGGAMAGEEAITAVEPEPYHDMQSGVRE